MSATQNAAPSRRPQIEERVIGHVQIDSGQLIMADPCRVEGDRFPDGGMPWELLAKLDAAEPGGMTYLGVMATLRDEVAGQLRDERGCLVAVASKTGWGDGVYPVVARVGRYWSEPRGCWEERVLSVRIEFIDEEAFRAEERFMAGYLSEPEAAAA